MRKEVKFHLIIILLLLISIGIIFIGNNITGKASRLENVNQAECNQCGSGLFNICDLDECLTTAKECNFNKKFLTNSCNTLPELSIQDSEEIQLTRQAYIEIGHDYSVLYGLLEERKGQTNRLLRICKEFDSIYCLKKVSQQNPEIRNEICETLTNELRFQYKNRMTNTQLNNFIKGHEEDCSLGLPQFIY